MPKENILEKLKESLLNLDVEATKKKAEEALEAGIRPLEALRVMTESIRKIGELFADMQLFLPDVMMAAEAFEAGSAILRSALSEEDAERMKMGTVVIGTVKGDIHDLGRKIVAVMLSAAGFKIHDIGNDQSPENFVSTAEKVNADIIAMSCLMSSCLPYMEDTIQILEDDGVRDKYKILVGGGPGVLSPDYAKKMGADGYGKDGDEAVKEAKRLLGK